jgi:hypothetical protein
MKPFKASVKHSNLDRQISSIQVVVHVSSFVSELAFITLEISVSFRFLSQKNIVFEENEKK